MSKTVSTIVSLLGGPEVNAEEIEWAMELPSARRLLEWLASQAQQASAIDDGKNASNPIKAALQAISLEDEELKKLRDLATPRTVSTEIALPSGYIPPWRLRPNSAYIEAESALFEVDTEVLKSRLQQTKQASQKLSQAIKTIASAIDRTDKDILATEEKISQLSVHADVATLASVTNGLETLCVLESYVQLEQDETPHAASLSTISSINTALVDRFQSQMSAIDTSESRLPTPSEIQTECARLDAALNTPRAGGKSQATQAFNATYELELSRLCQALEDPKTTESAIAEVLTATDLDLSVQPPVIDVRAELEDAWIRDQVVLLETREVSLDQAIAGFSDSLLPSLTDVHDELAATDSTMREAQALVEALREEIHDIIADMEPQETATASRTQGQVKDAELQAGLGSLLKELKEFRPPDASPLILLNQEDILEELRSIYERDQVSRRQEEAWTTELLPTLRTLEAVHAPLLSAAYEHSRMNTSPPFTFPPDIQAVQVDAKVKSDDLANVTAKLQEGLKTLKSDRTTRRLEHFISKWA